MAEEIGALRAMLALETAAFDKGVASARRQLTGLEGGFQKTGGQVVQFGQRMSRDATAGFNSLNRSAGASRAGLQNFGYQVQDVAVQIAGGTSATRALSQQLPQLLSGFGLFGIALGTASAVLIPLIGNLWQGSEATRSWANELSLTSGSISSVQGAVSGLEAVQRAYVDAIAAQGPASSAASALVITNSAKEFQAKKQLLALEIELLKIRGQEQAQDAKILRDQFDSVFAKRIEQSRRIEETRQEVLPSSPFTAGPGLPGADDAFRARMAAAKGREADLMQLRKLNAELALTNLNVSRTEALMNTTFDTIGAGAPAATEGFRQMGGGIREAGRETAAALKEIKVEAKELSKAADQINASFEGAFADIATGAKSLEEGLSGVLKNLADMMAQSAALKLNAALFGGAGIGGKLAGVLGFADGGIVNSPTVFPMANGAGLMGEAGPEPIMPLTRIGGKLGVRAAGGGNTTVHIDARYATEGTAAMIVKAIQQAAPSIVRQSVSATRAASARGY